MTIIEGMFLLCVVAFLVALGIWIDGKVL